MRRHLAATAIALLCACAPAPQKAKGIRVVTTIGVLGDWARQVGGDRVLVTSLLTGSEDSHTYEAKPEDARKLAGADVIFRVGLGLEEWLDPVIQNAAGSKARIVDASAGIIDIVQGDADEPIGNPHIWLDPQYAKVAVGNLVRELIQVDPRGESLYRARQAAYGIRLDSLTSAIAARTAALPDRRLIAFHDAWPYFARRFGLDVVASIEPVPGKEPSARELARLVDLIRRDRIRLVLSEPQLPSSLPEMLARETGVKTLVLDPLCGGTDASLDYIAAIGRLADAIAAALDSAPATMR
jgi:manganese/iron transport system substrate-binding protein